MALSLVRRIDRIEISFPNPALQVRYLDCIVNDEDGSVVAERGYHREVFDLTADLSAAPLEIQAAQAAMAAFRRANPDRQDKVPEQPLDLPAAADVK
jgi:regulator of RNase E activity RraA